MKRVILAAFVMGLTLPVLAQQVDSPLVALAKRTSKLRQHAGHVITNEDVARAAGRISVATRADEGTGENAPAQPATATTGSAPAAPKAVADPWAASDAAYAARVAKEKNAPAAQQPQMEGSTRASYTTPAQTAQNANVSSSATSSTGQSTAPNATVQSTASSTNMNQNAPASSPPPVAGHKVD